MLVSVCIIELIGNTLQKSLSPSFRHKELRSHFHIAAMQNMVHISDKISCQHFDTVRDEKLDVQVKSLPIK